MNQDELEKIKKEAWEIHNREYNINIEPCDEFDFKEGFNVGVEALQKELDEAIELLQNRSRYSYEGRILEFLAKVKKE
jgi:ribosomal protein L18